MYALLRAVAQEMLHSAALDKGDPHLELARHTICKFAMLTPLANALPKKSGPERPLFFRYFASIA
jgi:hypothetical protein